MLSLNGDVLQNLFLDWLIGEVSACDFSAHEPFCLSYGNTRCYCTRWSALVDDGAAFGLEAFLDEMGVRGASSSATAMEAGTARHAARRSTSAAASSAAASSAASSAAASSAAASSAAVAELAPMMKAPPKFTLEMYQQSRKGVRGRIPPKRRRKSAGSMVNDGGHTGTARKKRAKKVAARHGRAELRSVQRAQSALNSLKEW